MGVLTCQPGGVYDITPVAFNAAPVPTDGRFVVLDNAEHPEEEAAGEILAADPIDTEDLPYHTSGG